MKELKTLCRRNSSSAYPWDTHQSLTDVRNELISYLPMYKIMRLEVLSKKLPSQIHQVARGKLRMINYASINDLRIPPSNRLEKLKGDLKNYHSIRIDDRWRVIFRWSSSDAYAWRIMDYHD